MRLHGLLESGGRRLWPIFSGVIAVEAQKRLYQGIPAAQRASRRVFVPVLSPQGAPSLGMRFTAEPALSAQKRPRPRRKAQ
jgi:hypothetical protein